MSNASLSVDPQRLHVITTGASFARMSFSLLLYSTLFDCCCNDVGRPTTTISTIRVDRDDVAEGGGCGSARRDGTVGGRRGRATSVLALVWNDGLLGNVRNRRVPFWILAYDEFSRSRSRPSVCLWTRKIAFLSEQRNNVSRSITDNPPTVSGLITCLRMN